MKKNKQFVGQLIRDYIWQLLLYLLIVGLLATTFYLHDLPWIAYQDAILFSIPLVVGLFLVKASLAWRKHKKLQHLAEQKWQVEFLDELPNQRLLEKDYAHLLQKLSTTIGQITYQKEHQQTELIDYYALWSHQIKTPLAALDLMIQIEEGPRKKELKNEVFKIQQYLDMMLQYLRMESMENDFVFREFPLEQVVKPIIKKFAPFFIEKGLEIDLQIDGVHFVSDEKWLSFILEQIIFNGIKYTKTGKITIKSESPNSFMICDTGQGILEEDIPRIFEKGYTGLNGRTNQKATGLGLYMSKEIADKLGIQMTVTSEVGKGTKVLFFWSQASEKKE